MSSGDITNAAIQSGELKTNGKTPENTMSTSLHSDVKKLDKAIFTRPSPGLFGLREWIQEEFFPPGWAPEHADGLASLKGRKQAGGIDSDAPIRRASSRLRNNTSSSMQADQEVGEIEEEAGEERWEEGEGSILEEATTAALSKGDTLPQGGGPSTSFSRSIIPQQNKSKGRRSPAPIKAGAAGSRVGAGDIDMDEVKVEDELESPLHVLLGAMEGVDNWGAGVSLVDEKPGNKRSRRPSSGATAASSGPKSPYEDPLAALYEIATSPSTFARQQIAQQASNIGGLHQGITYLGQVHVDASVLQSQRNQSALFHQPYGQSPFEQPQQPFELLQRSFGTIFAAPATASSQLQERKDLSEVEKMKAVVERLETRMGRKNPQVGKAWLHLARMYQHASGSISNDAETKEQCREGAAQALAMAVECSRELTREHNDLALAPRAKNGFDYLVERIQRQRQEVSLNKLEQELM